MEARLSALTETKDSLLSTNRTQERTIDSLKNELHEERTTRKLAEQKAETMKVQLDETSSSKVKDLLVPDVMIPAHCG